MKLFGHVEMSRSHWQLLLTVRASISVFLSYSTRSQLEQESFFFFPFLSELTCCVVFKRPKVEAKCESHGVKLN